MENLKTFNQIYKEYLSPLAVKDEESEKRKYKVNEDKTRSNFERDRDRILYASSFRRLAYKTQVFIYNRNNMHRTRLTHSLEVAQLSRTISQVLGMNSQLCEAISLAHDLGYAPFGHAGEYTLNSIMSDEGGFEHNEQSLRVVDYIEKRFPEHSGLNLTFATREGIIKHKTGYDKPGKINQEFLKRNSTIETEIVSVADRISYNTHDLEDGIREQILSLKHIEEHCSLWREITDSVRHTYFNYNLNEKDFFYRCKSLLLKKLIDDVIETSLKNIKRMNLKSFDEVISLNRKEQIIALSPDCDKKLKEIESYLYKFLYESSVVVKMNDRAKYFILSVYDRYKKNPKLLPKSFIEQLDPELKKNSSINRIICDYIAGMTDAYLLEKYKDLFDPDFHWRD